MLIGVVGGLALAKLLAYTRAISLPPGAYDAAQFGTMSVPLGLTGLGLVLGSACLALWPDLDEPNSKPAQYLKTTVALITTPLTGLIGYGLAHHGYLAQRPMVATLTGFVLGATLLGPMLGYLLLRLIHIGAGGHRRLTHSGVLSVLLVAIAWCLWRSNQPVWALIPAALVWGQVLHVLGDLVTPAGVPVLYPFSSRDVGLPQPFSQLGESLITVAAIGVGYWLLWSAV
ncbi:MAG: metal-dependent hydrolase [Chloroflexota bacterium]|nr:metal-dependent hydrolase [Chloroflexota bacterium]